MNQKSKNIRLLIVFGLMLIITTGAFLTLRTSNSPAFDKGLFTLGENTVITDVRLANPKGDNIALSYIGGSWQVNDLYGMDESMRDVFFAVLSTVEIRQPVSRIQKDSIANYLETVGTEVIISNNGQPVMSYLVGGNRDKFLTYFMEPGSSDPYQMQIPGYLSYIAGIYTVPLSDWRERYIWTMDWSRLKSFTVEMKNSEPLHFFYGTDFIQLEGIKKMDTGLVMDYLQYAANLQALEFVKKPEALEENFYARIQLTEIADRKYSLELFEISERPDQLVGELNGKERVIMDKRQVDFLLRKKEDFLWSE